MQRKTVLRLIIYVETVKEKKEFLNQFVPQLNGMSLFNLHKS